jgi:hypothetical protein
MDDVDQVRMPEPRSVATTRRLDDIRVISIFATRWRYRDQVRSRESVANGDGSAEPVTDQEKDVLALKRLLPLGRLEEFHDLFADKLPRVLHHGTHGADGVVLLEPAKPEAEREEREPKPADDGVDMYNVTSWLFVLPSDQVVAAIDLEFRTDSLDDDPAPTVALLEHGAYAQLLVNGQPLEQHIADLAGAVGAKLIEDHSRLPPERHQIVIVSHQESRELPADEVVQRILYRVDPPFRPEFMKVRSPDGLNRAKHTLGAVTPYTSLLYGHPDYIENSVFLTTVQAVGTAARFRQIWHRAHGQVRQFRYERQEEEVGKQRREDMERLVDELGNLELDLSFSVETSADLGLLIPSLRIESFHHDLYEAMELQERANRVSRMFTRLDSSIHSELTAIEIRDRNETERKSRYREWVISLLTLVGVPLAFFFGFLGINASQVESDWSMFSIHYAMVYAVAFLLMVIPAVTLIWPLVRERRRRREEDAERRQRHG